MWVPVGLLCSRNARPSLRKKVKAEAEVEQRSIRAVASFPLNLDLSLDLPTGCAQWRLNQTD